VGVPLVGTIAASDPVPMPDDAGQHFDEDDLIDVPAGLIGPADPRQLFALRVRGDSMIDAMIAEGDIVVLRRQNVANNGDMVAAWLISDSRTTLKYYFHEGKRIRLQPAHPAMEPIYVAPDDLLIHGRVLSVLRTVH
jgi:repressor LexA